MFKDYRHLIRLGIVSTILVVPYGLKLLSKSLEIYPAIIFPAGAVTLEHKDGWHQMVQHGLFGVDVSTKKLKQLDKGKFLNPVPIHYLSLLLFNEFGLNPDIESTIYFRYFKPLRVKKFSSVTETDREETRDWLRNRLIAAGCDDEVLIIRKTELRINRDSGEIEYLENIHEKTISLR
ncbi:MAG: hypothetical protein O7C75_14410 [Verrucomicrobia bacterium]|nr:hypothetical protein [Verrucomicrobiota bacterium]